MKAHLFKTLKLAFAFVLFSTTFLNAQNTKSLIKAWDHLLNKPELANYFTDVFVHLGITVEETQSKFTVHHMGDHFTITEGINKDSVDYIAHLKLENIKRMAKHGDDNAISEYESYRILSVLFTPLTRASLKNDMMTRPLMRKFAGIENHIHIYLISPDGSEKTAHTLIFVNKEWMVIEGIHGNAKRTFTLLPSQALEYQRHVFTAISTDTNKEWKNFKNWYLNWRKGVSESIK